MRCGGPSARSTGSRSTSSSPTPIAAPRRGASRPAPRSRSRRSSSTTAAIAYATDGTPVDCVRFARPRPGGRAPGPDRLGHQPRLQPRRRHHLLGHGRRRVRGDRARDPGDRRSPSSRRAQEMGFLPGPQLRLRRGRRGSGPSWCGSWPTSRLPAETLLNVNCPGGRARGDRGHPARASASTTTSCGSSSEDERRPPPLPDLRLRALVRGRARDRPRGGRRGGGSRSRPVHFDLTDRDGLDRLRDWDLGPDLRGSPVHAGARPRRRRSEPAGPAKRAEELRREIAHHDHRYYVLDDPEIGDDAYDALLRRAARDRGGAPRPADAGLADAARAGGMRRWTSSSRSATPSRCSRSANARERRGVPRLGEPPPQPPAPARHRAGRPALRLRAEDRRPRDLAHLRGRRVRARRDARRRA